MIEENGVQRHTMTKRELEKIYFDCEEFVADLTLEEYQANENEIKAFLTLLHQRIQNN